MRQQRKDVSPKYLRCYFSGVSQRRIRVLADSRAQCTRAADRSACVAAQEVGFDNLREIVDGRPCGIDMLIRHMRGMVFFLTEHESKELFRHYFRPGGSLSRQNGESMQQHVSRHDDVAGHSWFRWTQ